MFHEISRDDSFLVDQLDTEKKHGRRWLIILGYCKHRFPICIFQQNLNKFEFNSISLNHKNTKPLQCHNIILHQNNWLKICILKICKKQL